MTRRFMTYGDAMAFIDRCGWQWDDWAICVHADYVEVVLK